ncbi:leucine zipper protein 2 isoform X3 [Equus caballus]|uniref:leucine zipper protein 2 isoform X3 n=1 Tax=Equus caballus TaxID=9796 RepID=UPI0038B27AC9
MQFSPALYLLPLLPALILSTRRDSRCGASKPPMSIALHVPCSLLFINTLSQNSTFLLRNEVYKRPMRRKGRQDYEELERQLKEVFKERSTILYQLTKTARELDRIKDNLQSLKNVEKSAQSDVQMLLEIGQKQREQMKSLQDVLQIQLKETADKAEKQQATINFLKTEMERKSKMIRDLQNENKSLKNKLLSGRKLCGLHAEESKRIQSQLKELRYGKKDLLFKAQQLTDLEQKLAVAKNELEKAAFDQEAQLKAMKETIQLCLSTVFRDQPPALSLFRVNPTQMSILPKTVDPKIPDAVTEGEPQESTPGSTEVEMIKEENLRSPECDPQNWATDRTLVSSSKVVFISITVFFDF